MSDAAEPGGARGLKAGTDSGGSSSTFGSGSLVEAGSGFEIGSSVVASSLPPVGTPPFRFFGPLALPLRISCNGSPAEGSLGASVGKVADR